MNDAVKILQIVMFSSLHKEERMNTKRWKFSGKGVLLLTAIALLLTVASCGDSSESRLTCYTLSLTTKGCIETVDNILNMTVVSKNENVLHKIKHLEILNVCHEIKLLKN